MNLTLAKTELFNSAQCDFWRNENNEVYMTREQIGAALEYSEPRKAIHKIHERNQERLDKFSVVTKLTTTDKKSYDTIIYNERGIYEIIRFSKQPKANAFYDFVYDLLGSLRKGDTVLIQPSNDDVKLLIQKQRAEAMLLNAKTRQAKLILEMQKNKTLSPVAVELLSINALETITDQTHTYRPQLEEKHYTATEIGNEFGVSSQRIGRLATANNLKTTEYGIWVLDKSRHSSKQVESFKYNEKGREKLKQLLEGVTA